MIHPDPLAYPPRGMSREEAARYVGVGVTKFDQMVADGRMPRPKRVDGWVIWDRLSINASTFDLAQRSIDPNPLDRVQGNWSIRSWLDRFPVVEETFYTRIQAADRCGISLAAFNALVEAGLLPAPLEQGWWNEHLREALAALDPLLSDKNIYNSYVYFIACEEFCKIGFSADPEIRLANLQSGVPFELKILHTVVGGETVERKLHEMFSGIRVRGEWFRKTTALLAYIEWLKARYPS